MPVLDGKKYPYTKEGMRRYRRDKKKQEKSKGLIKRTKEGFKKAKIQRTDGRNMSFNDYTNEDLKKRKREFGGTLMDVAERIDASSEYDRRTKKAKKQYDDAPKRAVEKPKREKKSENDELMKKVRRYLRKKRERYPDAPKRAVKKGRKTL